MNKIRENRAKFLAGQIKVIPCTIERFNKKFHGIRKGDYICFTGGTSSGKTTITKKMAVFDAIEYAIEKQWDLKILYFGLEETKEEFEYSVKSYLLRKLHNLRYNILDFEFITGDMPEEDLDKTDEIEPIFQQWMSYVNYYDNVYNPYGIYSKIKEFAESRGKFTKSNPDHSHWDTYEPDNPEEFILTIVDHIGLLTTEEKHLNKIDAAMKDMSFYLRQYVSKKFNYTAISVQQQMAENENLEHIQAGRWMPTLNGFGENKRVARDYLTVVGIGNPKRYGVKSFGNYNGLIEYDGFLRFLVVLKQRYGECDDIIGIMFDGKCNWIKEAPNPTDTLALNNIKNYINSLK